MTATVTPAAKFDKAVARKMSEAALQRDVEALLRQFGWRYYHCRPGQTVRGNYVTALSGDKGFPDICAIRGGRLLFAELKRQGGKLEPAQEEWRDAIHAVRWPEYYEWRPSDLLNGSILRALQ